MVKFSEKSQAPRKLKKGELSEIERHPVLGAELASREGGLDPRIAQTIKQEHERLNGSGYPGNAEGGEISDDAQIIGLVDVYEAVTHSRPHRGKMQPHEAIREILVAERKLFSPKLIKALVKCIGVYPIGSWIETNTGEIGKVAAVNEDFPLRPVVNIIFDSQGFKLKKIKQLDLKRVTSQYIKNSVREDRLRKLGDNL
jgi:HD-GYP domain-containing protein (c-di-GMP phosphodiesterase class II)